MHVKRKRSKGYLRRPPKLIVDRQPSKKSAIPPVYDPPHQWQIDAIAAWGSVEPTIDIFGTELTFKPHPLFIADLPEFVVRHTRERGAFARCVHVLSLLIKGVSYAEIMELLHSQPDGDEVDEP